jgi:hypothetical protein
MPDLSSIAIQADVDLEQLRARLRQDDRYRATRFRQSRSVYVPSWIKGRTAEGVFCPSVERGASRIPQEISEVSKDGSLRRLYLL